MNRTIERYAGQLGALGHPARLAILRQIVQSGAGGLTTTTLQARLGIPWTTLNHHLDRLVTSRLLKTRREGRLALHTADYDALGALTDYLWKDCCKSGGEDCC